MAWDSSKHSSTSKIINCHLNRIDCFWARNVLQVLAGRCFQPRGLRCTANYTRKFHHIIPLFSKNSRCLNCVKIPLVCKSGNVGLTKSFRGGVYDFVNFIWLYWQYDILNVAFSKLLTIILHQKPLFWCNQNQNISFDFRPNLCWTCSQEKKTLFFSTSLFNGKNLAKMLIWS